MSYVCPTIWTLRHISIFGISQFNAAGFTGIGMTTWLKDKSSIFRVKASGFEKKKLSNIIFSLCPGARRRFDAFVVKGFEMRKKHCCAETTCEEINAFDNLIKIQEIGL